jgi:aspartate-semialdehyde dehydrogenase
MDKSINLALIGASGVVGQKILQLLEKKNIKINKLFPLGKVYCWSNSSISKRRYCYW